MIPCIEDKCISYPACINKIEIECPEIETYYNVIRAYYDRNEAWNIIRKTLKAMRSFRTFNEEPEEDPEGN